MRFTNKHVIITGGSSGIGLATARRLVARGASVSLIARDRARLAAAAEELRPLAHKSGQRVEIATADVARENDITQAIGELTRRVGPCDVLMTSAGAIHLGYFEHLDVSAFREMMEVDYFGTLYAVRAVVPQMIQRRCGSILAISSIAGVVGVFGYTPYAPAKFAVRGLMETLRQELKPYNIHVGVVYPPDTQTPRLPYENQLKPLETRLISGKIKTVSADQMARAIIKGLSKHRPVITVGVRSALLVRVSSVISPMLNTMFDRTIQRARRERKLADEELSKEQ